MKSNMSKILSILLALSLAISLLPATFAADGEASNVKIVYDFMDNYTSDVPYTESENSFFSPSVNLIDTYDKSNGFWKFYAMEGRLWVNHRSQKELFAYFTASASWFAIKVRVPVADTYTASIGTIETSSHESSLEVYVLDADYDATAIANSVSTGKGKIGAVDCTKGGWSYLDSERRNLGNVTLDAGEHIVVFHAANGLSARIWSFALTAGDGSKNVPISAEALADKTELDIGAENDSAQISVSSVMYSDTTLKTEGISTNDFVFTSSDNAKATVDENGKVTVAANALPGKASINIASKDNPGFAIKTIDFEMVSSESKNLAIVYDFVDNFKEGVPYTSGESNFFTHMGINEVDTFDKSNGLWKFEALSGDLSVNHTYTTSDTYSSGLVAYFKSSASWYAIRVKVPVTGTYNMKLGHRQHDSYENALGVYILGASATNEDMEASVQNGTGKVGTVDLTQGSWNVPREVTLGNVSLSAGEHIILFHSPNGKRASIINVSLINGDGSNSLPVSAKVSASDVEVGESSAIYLNKVFMSDATESTTATGITYESSDSSVLSVSGSVIRGVKAGSAEILVKYNGKTIATEAIAVSEPKVSEPVSFVATSTNGAKISVSGIDYNGAVDSVTPGQTVTVTAPEVEGYKFRYWKNGNKNGRYVSFESGYTFKLVTHTYLIAVYDKVEEGKVALEFFNGNGAFIESKSVTAGGLFGDNKIENPTMTGFGFIGWSLADSDVISKDTRAVALYNETGNAVDGVVKVNGTVVDNPTYDKEVECKEAGATHWLRDGRIVAYGENYTHYIWDETIITSSTEAVEMKPVIILEDTKVDGAYMIEYDGAGYEVVEAGIVFGNADATVGSCSSKATSQRNKNHGQFTAKADGNTQARGYLIYNDNGTYRVIYAD